MSLHTGSIKVDYSTYLNGQIYILHLIYTTYIIDIMYKPTIGLVLRHCNILKSLIQVPMDKIYYKGAVLKN